MGGSQFAFGTKSELGQLDAAENHRQLGRRGAYLCGARMGKRKGDAFQGKRSR
jgi:hypothetical protein